MLDEAEALREAADCLSEALASRIVDGEEIPARATARVRSVSRLAVCNHRAEGSSLRGVAPARHDGCRPCRAARHGLAPGGARLSTPRRASKLTSLSAALRALDCEIRLLVHDPKEQGEGSLQARAETFVYGRPRSAGVERSSQQTPSLSDATLRAVQAHGAGATAQEVLNYLSREFGMTVRANHLGIVLQRHRRSGRLENRDQRWYSPSAKVNPSARPGGARVKRD